MPPTILTLLDHYLPGHKAGGPVRSVHQMVAQLGGEFRFRVVTRDRDAGDSGPYPGVPAGRWCAVGGSDVLYLPPPALRMGALRRVLVHTPHDVLYLNSLFSSRLSAAPLLLRRMGAIPDRPTVLAPRGELHPGALGTGTWGPLLPRALAARLGTPRLAKKRAFLRAAMSIGLFEGVVWQASTDEEREDILAVIGRRARVVVAPDLVPPPADEAPPARGKTPGELRVVFLSRLSPKKNLRGGVEALRGVRGAVRFDIYGPVDDPWYWNECRAELRRLPPNVTVRYRGPVPHEAVAGVFRDAHLLLLPTLGENFGHVVLEALAEGCPVLISDQTPWRGLAARRAGWDLSLSNPSAFTAALQQAADMDADEFARWSRGAARLAHAWKGAEWPAESNRALFASVLGAAPAGPREDGVPHHAAPRPEGLSVAETP